MMLGLFIDTIGDILPIPEEIRSSEESALTFYSMIK